MNTTASYSKSGNTTVGIVRAALVAALYVAITLVLGPLGSGVIQVRISEMFNFLAFYNKRYIWAVTIGCVIANYFTYGLIDMVVGGLHSLVFLLIGVAVTKHLKGKRFNIGKLSFNVQFLAFTAISVFSMVVIAAMLSYLYGLPLLPTWLTVGIGQLISLTIGMFVIENIAKRIDLTK